jgi:hypothetical protein
LRSFPITQIEQLHIDTAVDQVNSKPARSCDFGRIQGHLSERDAPLESGNAGPLVYGHEYFHGAVQVTDGLECRHDLFFCRSRHFVFEECIAGFVRFHVEILAAAELLEIPAAASGPLRPSDAALSGGCPTLSGVLLLLERVEIASQKTDLPQADRLFRCLDADRLTPPRRPAR